MALSDSAVSELQEAFRTGEGVELVRAVVRVAMQELIEAEVAGAIGAGRYERTEARVTERNGSRPRLLATTAGDIGLASRSCGRGRSSPSFCNRAGASTRRCTRWSWRPTCMGFDPLGR